MQRLTNSNTGILVLLRIQIVRYCEVVHEVSPSFRFQGFRVRALWFVWGFRASDIYEYYCIEFPNFVRL